ncbi:MAG: hypothetical protein JKY67_13330 [Pseudomonadales bacterium]|nr:hypothetical protein [Pseudomonadales bacterium]
MGFVYRFLILAFFVSLTACDNSDSDSESSVKANDKINTQAAMSNKTVWDSSKWNESNWQ